MRDVPRETKQKNNEEALEEAADHLAILFVNLLDEIGASKDKCEVPGQPISHETNPKGETASP